jgi:hypothetical protein
MGIRLGKFPMTRRHLDWNICRRRQFEADVLLHTGAAYVRPDRMHNLYRVSLFWQLALSPVPAGRIAVPECQWFYELH